VSDHDFNASAAQDHLEMVDRILKDVDRKVRLLPEPFIAFGIAGGIADLVAQLVFINGAFQLLFVLSGGAWLIAAAVTIFASRQLRKTKDRFSVLDGQLYALLNVIWIVTLLLSFGAQPHIFGQWAAAGIWSFAYGIALIFVGTQGSRVAFAGGIILIASIIGANFLPAYTGYVFAAGMWLGMAGTGVALLITQRDNE